MKDICTETVVPIAPDPKDNVRKWAFIAALALSGAMTLYAGSLFLILTIIFGILLYQVIQRESQEYEYVHTNDLFDIDIVIGNRKRKTLVTVKLSEVLIVAPCEDPDVLEYRYAKTHDYSGGTVSDNLYAMVCTRDGKYAKVILLLDRTMLVSLKQWIPDRVKL